MCFPLNKYFRQSCSKNELCLLVVCVPALPHVRLPPSAPSAAASAQWPHSSTGCPPSLGPVLPAGAPGRSNGCAPQAGAGRGEPLNSSLLAASPCAWQGLCAGGLPWPLLSPITSLAPPLASSPPSPRHWGEHQEDMAGIQRCSESLWPSRTGERAG